MATTMVRAEALEDLAGWVRGELITPGTPGYDQARAVYNAMIDRRPAVIVRGRDAADVVACVRFARAHGLALAVRGGGHNAAGLGVWDDALVVDMSDHATAAFGMATPSGFLASTGVAGLTLGGGIGYLARRFGLTVDNLLSADVVLADGTLVTASETSHPDLFWALRGGGGNFGVVVSFTFRCHPIGENGVIIGGPVLYDLADTREVMRWYRELIPSLPEELSGWLGLIPPAPPFPEQLWGRKSCAFVWCFSGPHDRADAVLEPIRRSGSPLVMGLRDMPFTVLQSAFDPLYPAGLQWYWRADMFSEISDSSIEVHERFGAQLPTGQSTMHLCPVDGAAARVPGGRHGVRLPGRRVGRRDRRRRPRSGQRGPDLAVDQGLLDGPVPDVGRRCLRQLRDGRGAGVNFVMGEGQDRARAAYRGNYERLTRVKPCYDPGNLFHVNQNILPAGSPSRGGRRAEHRGNHGDRLPRRNLP